MKHSIGHIANFIKVVALSAIGVAAPGCATTIEGGAAVMTPYEERVEIGRGFREKFGAFWPRTIVVGLDPRSDHHEIIAATRFVQTIPDSQLILGGTPDLKLRIKRKEKRKFTDGLSIEYLELEHEIELVDASSNRVVSKSSQLGLCIVDGGPNSSPAPCSRMIPLTLQRAMEKLV